MTTPDRYRLSPVSSRPKDRSIPKLSLKYNPFPRSSSISITAQDKLSNGSLFNPKVREETVREFQEKFIEIDFNDLQHLQMGFLWSLGRGEEQKGFGKTALLAYYLRKVNANYGADLPNEQKVAAIYIKPESTTNNLKKIAGQICESLLQRDPVTRATILTDAIRTIRYIVIQQERPQTLLSHTIKVSDFQTEEDFERLTNRTWVEKDWKVAGFDRGMADYLIENGVGETIAETLANYHEQSVAKITRLMAQRPTEFLFKNTVSILKAAGFDGLYIFIDDLYAGISNISARNRDTFANDVRHWFFDAPDSKAAIEKFFATVIIFHPDLERSLAESWRNARLNEIANFDINQSPGNNVELNWLLKLEDITELIKAYTEPAIDGDDLKAKNPLHPLSEETIQILTPQNQRGRKPGELLQRAYGLVEKAKIDGVEGLFTKDYVKKFVDSWTPYDRRDDDDVESYIDIDFG